MNETARSTEIKETLRRFAEEFIREHQPEGKDLLRPPLLCFADADSKRFVEITKIVDGHVLPHDVLSTARTVISVFLPISAAAAADNENGVLGSREWLEAFDLLESLNGQIAQIIADKILSMGGDAAVPSPELVGNYLSGTAKWSQRHVAWAAGLGTFGINNMLITRSGCVGRLYSIVTSMICQPDEIPDKEYCAYRRNKTCGVCMEHCPPHAFSAKDGEISFDPAACMAHCSQISPGICGKCMVGLPCTLTAPGSEE